MEKTSKLLEFFIPITPKAASRPRFRVCGRFAQAYTEPKYKAFMEKVVPLIPQVEQVIDKPVHIKCTFAISKARTSKLIIPKSDLDNYEKAIYDCITKAGVWTDDVLIESNENCKVWAEEQEGIMVEIYERKQTYIQEAKEYISRYLTLLGNKA